MTDPCRTCGHHEHKHAGGLHCCTLAVTGPGSDKGKPVGDGYEHGGRRLIVCDCTQFAKPLEVAR